MKKIIILLMVLTGLAFGQNNSNVEKTCPVGWSPVPSLTTYNPQTGKYRYNGCYDYIDGQLWMYPDASIVNTSVTAQSVNGILNTSKYEWSNNIGIPLTAGVINTVSPSWSSIPAGVTSGSVSVVSESSTSPTITWVSGDKFNTLWASGKPVNIDGTFLTISSCASATSCTLSGDSPRTTSYGWAVVGFPDSIYISGGTGTAEAVDVLGVGTECSGGTATSICFIPANTHSGAYTIQSATAGIQEAINAIEYSTQDVGSVEVAHAYVPAGNYTIYAPVIVTRHGVSITGAGSRETHISGTASVTFTGAANAWLKEFNISDNGIRDLYLSGTSGMNDISWACTTGSGGCGNVFMQNVQLDGATGTSTDDNGVSMNAAGVYINSMDGIRLKQVYAIYDNDGVFAQANGGGSGMVFSGGDYSYNTDDGLNVYGPGITGISVSGNRIFDNSNDGVYFDNDEGIVINGNHFEANKSTIAFNELYGASISGNLISQHIDSGSTCFICGNATGNPSIGLHIAGNEFNAQQGTSTVSLTSFVDAEMSSSTVGANLVDAFLTGNETIANFTTLESGSANNKVKQVTLGTNAQLSGKTLTITNNVDDVTAAYSTNGTYYDAAAGAPFTVFGSNGIIMTSESLASDHRLSISEGFNGNFTLAWYNHKNILNCAFSGNCNFYNPLVVSAGETIPSGQTLTNSGTFTGTGTANLSSMTVPGFSVGNNDANYLTFAGAASGSNPTIASNEGLNINTANNVSFNANLIGPMFAVNGQGNGLINYGSNNIGIDNAISGANINFVTTGAGTVQANGLKLSQIVVSGTATITPGSTVGCTDTTTTATGAATTNLVSVTPQSVPSADTNISWQGYVSAANTVDIHVCTIVALTASAITFNWTVHN